jgi:hypothetical protein
MIDGESEGEVMQECWSLRDVGNYLRYYWESKDTGMRNATRLE